MLYVFCGTDIPSVREKAFALLSKYETRGVSVLRVTSEQYVPNLFVDLASANSLFGNEQVTLIDTPSGDRGMYQDLLDSLDMLRQSKNIFLVIEEGLLAAEKKKLEKYAEEYTEIVLQKGERFNTFLLADAFSRRDKKSLWMLLERAKREGIATEEIIGVLFWQVKALRLAELTNSAREAGMKEFPYKKAQQARKLFMTGEIMNLSRRLVTIYHDSHLGKIDGDLALEKLALTL